MGNKQVKSKNRSITESPSTNYNCARMYQVYCAGSKSSNEYPPTINPESTDFDPVSPLTFGNEIIRNVACGYRCSFFLTESDHLYSCGQNSSGELGWGFMTESYQELAKDKTIIPSYGMIDYILSGDTFSFFVMKDGTFLRCGSNSEGYIGAGTVSSLSTPTAVTNPPWKTNRVDKISFGYYHSAVLSNNVLYQTGKVPGSDVCNEYKPIDAAQLKTIGKIVDVACGVFNTFCINDKGELFGVGQTTHYGESRVWTKMNVGRPVSKIFSGSLSALALTFNDEVMVFGDNGSGELGFGSEAVHDWTVHPELSGIGVHTIGIYTYQTIFITKSNEVYVAGNNTSGQVSQIEKKNLQRHPTLEKYCREHVGMIPHVTGGFQHMIVYFAKDTRKSLRFQVLLHKAVVNHSLSDIFIECGQ
ncbi:hypothetical protein FDP41_011512 [Naegleria fowleri]|uniref:Uncharacterized protein n=1 Tax=Naegleria fowleri TaxID=5763 RepID=A0A6A5C6U6_NAEFO|nr:uncharacterized protein FDP41_011512 [Naegleria fowleri]KAF0982582.1 hypothetical protein FDP41_011512 [Naegleria fowleri]